jgi:glycosyltransferase involved in cell wall biosynthesis
MKMRVLSVAFPYAPVSADPVGGAEQVLAQLDRHLVELGHESVVIAVAGSSVRGTLVPLPAPVGEWNEAACAHQRARTRELIAQALAQAQFDLIHCHGMDFAAYLPPPGIPLLVTLHLPLDRYPDEALRSTRPQTFLLPVSDEQCRGASPDLHLLPPIANGVPDNPFAGRARKRDFALALGRICPEKGFEDAACAARAAGLGLRIAGTLFPWSEHVRYFREELEPSLDPDRRWIGAVNGWRKQWWLACARCVLIASRARETSSLVAMESLAAGTPVIAYPSGAIPELIEHGVTGYLVDDVDGMAKAIGRIDEIDPHACIHAARERCRLACMLDAYLALYSRLTAHARDTAAALQCA